MTGATDTGVSWSVTPAVALAVNGNTVTFTAPADGTVQVYELTATSNADPGQSATATVEVLQFPLLLDPVHWIMAPGASFTFESWVDGVRDDDVNWSADGGTLTASGSRADFTAPLAAGDFTITLTSPKYPGLSATATVEVVSSLVSLSSGTGYCPTGLAANLSGGLLLIGTETCGDGDVIVLDGITGVTSGAQWAGLRARSGIAIEDDYPVTGAYAFYGRDAPSVPTPRCGSGGSRLYRADSRHDPATGTLSVCFNWPGVSPAIDIVQRGQATYYGVTDIRRVAGSDSAEIVVMGAAPTEEFWLTLASTSSDDHATAVAADSRDRAVIAGYTDGDYGPVPNSGGTDALVHSMLPAQSDSIIWSALIGTAGDDRATGVAVDWNDDVLVGGWLNPEPGVNELFIAKLDGDDGTELWRTTLGPTGDVGVSGLVTDSQGNVYVAGQYGAAGTEQHASQPGWTATGSCSGWNFSLQARSRPTWSCGAATSSSWPA